MITCMVCTSAFANKREMGHKTWLHSELNANFEWKSNLPSKHVDNRCTTRSTLLLFSGDLTAESHLRLTWDRSSSAAVSRGSVLLWKPFPPHSNTVSHNPNEKYSSSEDQRPHSFKQNRTCLPIAVARPPYGGVHDLGTRVSVPARPA